MGEKRKTIDLLQDEVVAGPFFLHATLHVTKSAIDLRRHFVVCNSCVMCSAPLPSTQHENLLSVSLQCCA